MSARAFLTVQRSTARAGSSGGTPANFVVTSDAEFATAHTAATAGQIIELADSGTFTSLTITKSGITVRGQTPGVPVLRYLTINGAQNVTVTGLKFQANDIPTTSPKIIDLRANVDGLVIDSNIIRGGNPWNSYADFDVTVTDEPRMGSASAGWGASNPYSGLWYGIGSGGSGATLPYGSITITNNTITDLAGGVKWGAGNVGAMSVKINGNRIGRIYGDLISFIVGTTTQPISAMEICGNELFDPFAQAQDNTNPHSDFIQFGATGTSSWSASNWLIAGNILWLTPGCRGGAQRIFLSDFTAGYPMIAPIVVDNILLSRSTSHGITILGTSEGAAWAYVRRNIVLARAPDNVLIGNQASTNSVSGIGPSTISIATTKVANSPTLSNAPNLIALNISEAYGPYASDRLVSNITTGGPATTVGAYATWLDTDTAPEWAAMTTADAVLTALTPKTGYESYRPMVAGESAAAFRARWATAGSRPWASLPSWTDWNDLAGVTIGSVQTSEWAFVHAGGPGASRALSISGGEYRIADDYAGTNATAWGSSAGTIAHGKYLQVRQTASASGSTATTLNVTIGAETMSWSVTTASAAAYPIVSLEGTTPDLFIQASDNAMAANAPTGTLALMRFKASSVAASRLIFTPFSGSGPVLLTLLSTGKLRLTLYNASNSQIARLDTVANVVDGNYHDILFSWDVNETTFAAGGSVYVDGSSSGTSATWSATPATVGYNNVKRMQIGMPAVDTFEMGALWLMPGTRIDLSNATNRAKFNADQIGSNGNGPTGAQPPIFIVGTAGQSGGWNDAAGINRGSALKLIKSGSAAATDVSGSAWV